MAQDMAQLDANELAFLRCHTIGYIFQTFNLIPVMTALENVEIGAERPGNTSLDLGVQAANPFNSWTGASSNTWDFAATNWTAAGNIYTNGQQVIFPAGPANRTIAGPAVAPQSIAVATASARLCTPSLLKMWLICDLTVFSER